MISTSNVILCALSDGKHNNDDCVDFNIGVPWRDKPILPLFQPRVGIKSQKIGENTHR